MRILLINYMETTAPGGINKVVREIAKNLSNRHEITVLQPNPLNLPEREIYEGFEIIRINSKISNYLYGFSPKAYFYLKKHLKELNPDIIHIHGYHTLFSPSSLYAIKKLEYNTPIIFSPYLDISISTFVGRHIWGVYNSIIGKKIFELVTYIISISNSEANNIEQIFNIGQDKISIIPLGVDTIDTIKLSKEQKMISLIYSGYLIKRKGVQYILKALYSLTHEFNFRNVILTIIGEGPEKGRLLRLAKDLQIEKYIVWQTFLPRKNLVRKIKKADVFILLSESESYGIAVAESLALGTPVIVTKRTALNEFLNEPGCFGVDYPPDSKEVAKLILKIINSNVKVGPFSNRIRTWESVAKDYEKVYNEING